VKALYPSLLRISAKIRLYHHLCLSKESGTLGTFFCSRLLVLVVERSLSPLRASLLIAYFAKAKLRYPSNSPDFQSESPLSGTLSIRNVGGQYVLSAYTECRTILSFLYKTLGALACY